jgi:formamidopyrimidine-DNA glycosylase
VPELPEVETVVRDLQRLLVDKCITSVKVGKKHLRRRWVPEWGRSLTGRRVRAIARRGKWIDVVLDEDVHLVVHLGMTGQLTVAGSTTPRPRHTHLVFDLGGGEEQLRFCDIRRFGSAAVYASSGELEQFFSASGLGPEPFAVNGKHWRQHLASTRRCLKAVLLDQRVVAGVGNIYADESLWTARLHPGQVGCDVTAAQAGRLGKAVVAVLSRAIERRGSSIRNYVGGSGLKGQYQEEFSVYGRTGEPCRRCRTPIIRTVLAGRSTHYCPCCQPAPGKG